MPYRIPSPVVVDVPGTGLKVFMPTGPRQGHQPTHYVLTDVSVILVACAVCEAAIGKLCVFSHGERTGTHWQRRKDAGPLTKNLRTNVLRFGKIIPDDVLPQSK